MNLKLFSSANPGQGSVIPLTYVNPKESVTDVTGTRTWEEYLRGLSDNRIGKVGGRRLRSAKRSAKPKRALTRRGRGRGRATRRRRQ
jgi:hypothetical protein